MGRSLLLKKWALLTGLVFPALFFAGTTYTMSRFDYTWCTTVYPTPYVTGSFSLIETSTANSGQDGFSKNQNNKTIILTLPAGFEFNAAAASTVTSSQNGGGANELTVVSFSFNTTSITVTLSVDNSNNYLNSLDFNNFQIRAMSSGSSGDLLRTGGTLQIEQQTTNPTAAESFGALVAATPYVYTSSSVTQSNTSNVSQFSIDQEIIRIKISGTGSCSGTVTRFDFSTVGGNATGTDLPATNISTAKVYFTGSSSTFATTTYFGSAASPNGAFTITGSQDLTTADSYFWLTYDVPGNANTGAGSNRLDAQLVDFVLAGSTISNMTTPTPAGSRTIIAATFYYSRFAGNWTTANIWSATSGGASCGCQPNGSGVVVIDGHAIVADATRTVDVIQINTAGALSGGNALTVNSVITTAGTGAFALTAALTCHGNVTLSGTGASSCSKIITIDGDLTVNSGTTLTASGGTAASVDQDIYIGGNLLVNGTLQQTGGKDIILNAGLGFNISGTGTIPAGQTFIVSGGSKSVLSGSTLTITPPFRILGGYTITNNGTVTLQDNLTASTEAAKWVNAAGSVLNYAGTTTMFGTGGELTASASSNTVNYNSASAQTIVYPTLGQYNSLTLSGASAKTLAADISVSGNWTNNTTLTHNNSGVTFNGTAAQTISGSSVPTFYMLTINNASGVTLSEAINVASSLALTSGLLTTTAANILTMQSGSTAPALTSASTSYVNGPLKYQKAVGGSSTLNIPIGKSPDCRPVTLTVNHVDATLYNYTAEVFNANPWTVFGSGANDMPTTVDTISGVHYVTIARTDNAGAAQASTGLVGNQTIQLYFGTNDFVYQGSTLTIVKNTSATPATWIDIGGSSTLGSFNTPQAGSVSSTSAPSAFTSFSSFALGSTATGWNSLPVDFLFFTAKPAGNNVDLSWSTASETDNDHFEVQRSSNGVSFDYVTTVKAHGTGNSVITQNYVSTDTEPYSGTSYYRLKQVDHNGQFNYSLIALVNLPARSFVALYPNPAANSLSIHVSSDHLQSPAKIIDMSGREVLFPKLSAATNQVDVSSLAAGTYFLIINGTKETSRIKFNVLR